MAVFSTQLRIGNRYQLHEQLGAGGMGAVYRATDHLTGQQIALKRLLLPFSQDGSSPADTTEDTRVALSLEFRTLASLRHPNIISVLDYGFDETSQPYFTMKLLDGAQTIMRYRQGQAVPEQVRLLVEMLQALDYLHRRGVIHRDLKPGNVLVSADGQVYVLDFGLSVAKAMSMSNIGNTTAGTPAYMAPEIFADAEATVRSDLYAVGVIGYELLTGKNPFEAKNFVAMLNNILNVQPDLTRLEAEIAVVIGRLLAKTPDERYDSAQTVITALCEAVGQPVPVESIAVRESFLQASQFVGRDAELGRLKDALRAMLDGRGSAWLIGGESGVGKSRLVDELRIRAMVRGAIALWGQGIAEGGMPYQLWRDPVRRLVLSAELTDLNASILKEIVPDISDLLDRAVPDAAPLDGNAGKQRLISAILHLFRSQRQPIVLIMEDLQWAVESLDVLQRLVGLVGELPLLIVGTFRDDEAPDLPEKLPEAAHLPLRRLTDDAIAALSQSMLGETGTSPHVIDLLRRETEGNAFFIVEVVRALAEDAGRLADVGRMTLPQQVFAQGMKTVVQRRLSRVPDAAHSLLALAAIAGRQLDQRVLMTAEPEANIDAWLTTCANAAVLDVLDNQWRFAHDKLREGVLDELRDSERAELHRRVAVAIETAYPDDAAQAAVLADHWRAAGQPDKEAHYAYIAAKQAHVIGNVQEARLQAQRALVLLPELNRERMQVLNLLGDIFTAQYLGKDAIDCYEHGLEIARAIGDQSGIFDALFGLGFIWGAHRYNSARGRAYFEEALQLADEGTREYGLALNGMGILALNDGDAARARAYFEQKIAINRTLGDKTGVGGGLNNLGIAALQEGDLAGAHDYFQQSLSIVQEIGNRVHSLNMLANLQEIAELQGDYAAARFHIQESMAVGQEYGIWNRVARGLLHLGLNALDRHDFEAAHQHLGQCLTLAHEHKLSYEVAVVFNHFGYLARLEQDYVLAQSHHEQALLVFHDEANPVGIGYTLRAMGRVAMDMGDFDAAYQYFLDSLEAYRERDLYLDTIESSMPLGQLARRQDDYAAANRHFQESLSLAREKKEWAAVVDVLCEMAHTDLLQRQLIPAQKALDEALRLAWKVGAKPRVLVALLGYAHMGLVEGQPARCAELLALAIEHPALGRLRYDYRDYIAYLHETLEAVLPPDQREAAFERGRALDLETVVAALLEEMDRQG